MPLDHQGIVNFGSDIDKEIEEKIKDSFKVIDRNIGCGSGVANVSY